MCIKIETFFSTEKPINQYYLIVDKDSINRALITGNNTHFFSDFV